MGQNRDRLTHELCQRGGKKAVVCSVQEGSWPYMPFWGCFLGEALQSAWFTFCFYDEQNIDSDLSVCTHRGPLEEPVCTCDWVPDRTALLPGEEWINSQGFCQLLGLGSMRRPRYHVRSFSNWWAFLQSLGWWDASLPRRLEVVLLFLGPGLEAANMQALLQIGSVAREQLLGSVGHVALTSFLNKAFLLVDLNSFPIHDLSLCRL